MANLRMGTMKRTWQLLSIPLVLVLLLAGLTPSVALDRKTRVDILASVVQISLVKIEGDDVYFLPWGSGTIISSDGLILSNCHVADPLRFGFPPEDVPEYDYLGIGLTVRSDQPSQLSYLAEVAQADPYLDLAVIRIISKVDGTAIRPDSLNLPHLERGDSNFLIVGDELNIFGYPGIGGDTVTFTKGVVSGFQAESAYGDRAWVKTDASISGGNSGGTAVDEDGNLVAIPTRAGDIDCRPMKDTNGDGMINGNDDCVPIGGFINALRPIFLAEPLIERAELGLPDTGKTAQPDDGPTPTGRTRLANLFFAPSVSELNQPTSVVYSLPSGSPSLYLFFDYINMTQGQTLEMKVHIDGQEAPDWGLPAGPWAGGEEGQWWIGWADADFDDGTYTMVISVDGVEMAEAEIEIGGPPTSDPSFSNITLGLESDSYGIPIEPIVLFPAGTQTLYAAFDYDNMSDGTEWTRTWWEEGEVALTRDEEWDSDRSGTWTLELNSSSGLAAGHYRLALDIEGELAAMTNFWVTGGKGEGVSFDPVTFAQGIDRYDEPVGAARSFSSGLDELHAFSEYIGMEDGMNFAVNWYIDGDQVINEALEWDGGEEGPWHYYIYSDKGALPDGDYGLELVVEGQLVQEASTSIGAGSLPTPEPDPTPADSVWLEGTISDLDTGRPIASAIFLVLKQGVTMDTFQWTDSEVYTSDDADRNGFYSLPDPLQRGECYTMVVGAEGYWTYGEDDVCLGTDTPDIADLPVRLESK